MNADTRESEKARIKEKVLMPSKHSRRLLLGRLIDGQ